MDLSVKSNVDPIILDFREFNNVPIEEHVWLYLTWAILVLKRSVKFAWETLWNTLSYVWDKLFVEIVNKDILKLFYHFLHEITVNNVSHVWFGNVDLDIRNFEKWHRFVFHIVLSDVHDVADTDVFHFDGKGAISNEYFVVVLVIIAVKLSCDSVDCNH